jgi:hypothetical protein
LTGISQLAATAAAAVLKPRYFKKSLRGAFASKKLVLLSSSAKGSSSLNSSFTLYCKLQTDSALQNFASAFFAPYANLKI